MASEPTEAGLSLLDRLIDEAPSRATDEPMTPDDVRRKVRAGLQRDISSLLGTRSWFGTWSRELDHVKTSVLNYGLPDVTGVAIGSEDVQEILRGTVRMAIEIYEPRLTATAVAVVNAPGSRSAQLLIQGDVRGDHQPVVFGGSPGQSTVSDLSKAGR